MRALQVQWQCDPTTNTLQAVVNLEGEICDIRVEIEDIQREIARVASYIQELSNAEASNGESENKQRPVSIVS